MRGVFLASVALGMFTALAGSASAQIKFGVAGPITGPNAAFGAQLKNGAQQAVEDLNAKGGLLGQKIELEVGDDVSDPKQGVSVANKFVGDGVNYVIGHFNSGVTIPASEVYNENGILAITPAATNETVTDRGLWNMFRVCGRDDQQGQVAGAFLAKEYAGKKVAIVHDKTTYGKGLADNTRANYLKAGGKDVLYEGVNTGEKDFSALVSKIKASGAEVVYWGGLHTEGGLIIRQLADQGVKAVLVSGDGIVSDEFAQIAGAAAEGTKATFGPDKRNEPAAKDVVAKFRANKFEPESYTLYSYAAVQVIAQAAEAAKSLDTKVVAETIHSGKVFKTVIGDITFNKNGDVNIPGYVIWTWKKDPKDPKKIIYSDN